MPRGGKREGAGRPLNVKDSPVANDSRRAKIKQNQIIQRLHKLVDGEIEMTSPAVTAALGLLRKVLPDLQAVEHSGQIETKAAETMSDNELASIAARGSADAAQAPVDPQKLN